jgi:hypothetical protein
MPNYLIQTILAGAPIDDRSPVVIERIVRASNKARAIAHVVADTLKVDVATVDDAMRVAGAGGKVEVAKEDA